ncbi:hypothetical protein TELCIR_13492 [Teladorsagia circumcincta]|uniref:Triacylglycerol lipase n=1 Tax=Teladorsagia circumcincta TaxID=45464 RepID=A0A2G9U3K8_TELCI|nr:hypothetical protein TELCIR_13492 [Teladorsagia circumcincta]
MPSSLRVEELLFKNRTHVGEKLRWMDEYKQSLRNHLISDPNFIRRQEIITSANNVRILSYHNSCIASLTDEHSEVSPDSHSQPFESTGNTGYENSVVSLIEAKQARQQAGSLMNAPAQCTNTSQLGRESVSCCCYGDGNGYDSDDFVRADYGTQGSYGGRTANAMTVSNTPVIFIHGNSDAALHISKTATGWSNTIEYFLDKSYTQAELYATSWGDTDTKNAVKSNGYDNDDFVRADYGTQGSYGGRTANAMTYFLDKGHTQAELYATSWGDTDTKNAVKR